MLCNICRESNPATDSVQLTLGAIAAQSTEEDMRRMEEAEAALQALEEAEEVERKRMEALAREAVMEEQRRQEEEAEARRRRLQEARTEYERKLATEKAHQAERERATRKEAARLAREQKRERDERQAALLAWCEQHGFTGVEQPRRSGCTVWGATTTFPLHSAAELGDTNIVKMLLREGVDKTRKNSAGLTALQVAQRKGKAGSHDEIQRLLAIPRPRAGGA